MKQTFIAFALATGLVASVAASAETQNFANKGAYAYLDAYSNNSNISIHISQYASRDGSQKTSGSAANVFVSSWNANECWYGWGYSDAVKLSFTGTLPNKLTASGTVAVNMFEYCSGNYTNTVDNVSFNAELRALKDSASQSAGTTRDSWGPYKRIYNYDYSSVPAAASAASYISGTTFGMASINYAYMGQQRSNTLSMSK